MPRRLVLQLDDRILRVPLADGTLSVGSAAGSEVRIPHYTVSRRHATLRVSPRGVEVEDLGSSNGTRVEGRRIEGTAALVPGATVAFGSVEGRLEEVAVEELEAALRVGPAAPGADPAGGPSPDGDEAPATVSLGSLETFTLKRLPELLERLLDGADATGLAPAVGAALAESLPAAEVEVTRERAGREGVLFRWAAGPPGPQDGRLEVQVPGGDLRVRAAFLSPLQAGGYRAVVEAAARLLALAGDPEPPEAAREIRRSGSPPLPEPPSLDPRTQRTYAEARRIARGDVSVMIRGESGTGKEVLARFLHAASERSGGPFVALNCAALPRDLLEAELFGVAEGAATGVSARPGKFELAHGGTLFLDEIGDMARETQAKILRVLQEGEVFRLGARAPRATDVRVISATNQDVDALRSAGTLRDDLYHRIADWRVELPPLRERRTDIPNLAAHFLAREVRRRGLAAAGISRAALEALTAYRWPGNVRELEREMARVALFLEEGDLVETSHLREAIRRGSGGDDDAGSLAEVVKDAERRAIRRAFEEAGGDTRRAAGALGIGRSTLYRKMADLGLETRAEAAGRARPVPSRTVDGSEEG